MGRLARIAALGALACAGDPVEFEAPEGKRLLRVPRDHATIQAAVDAAGAGDVVLVAPGVYREQVEIRKKAMTVASHFIASGAASHVERTVIQGAGGKGPVVAIRSGRDETTRLVGFTIRGGPAAGVDVRVSRVEILNNRLTANRDDGVGFRNSQAVVRGNTFADNGDDGLDSDGANALLIEDNDFLRNQQDGIEARLDDHDGPLLEVTVRRNVFRQNGSDGIQLIDYPSVTDRVIRIERNVFEGNAIGIGCMPDGQTDEAFRGAPLAEPVHVLHNTFVANRHGLTGGDNMALVNNLFAFNLRSAFARLGGRSVASHNLVWRNAGEAYDVALDPEATVRGDPLLDGEHRPRVGSAAIDAGATSFPHDGDELIPPASWAGAAPDLGAFERE
jgi:hypothetical protein